MNHTIFMNEFKSFQNQLQKIEAKFGLFDDLTNYKNICLAIEDLLNNYHNNATNYNLEAYIRLVEDFKGAIDLIDPSIKFPKGLGIDPLYHFKRAFSSFMNDIISQSLILKVSQKNMSQERKCFAPHHDLKNCSVEIIGAHTISNGNNFKNKQLYTFDKVYFKKEIQYDSKLKKISPEEASIGYVFCKNHDAPLFSAIEINNNIDISNPSHHLLQNYRIFYKMYSEDRINIKENIQNKIIEELEKKYSQTPYSSIYLKSEINNFIKAEKNKDKITKEKQLSYDIDTQSDAIFRRCSKQDLSYLVFTLNIDTKIFSSSCGMAKYINNKMDNDTELLYFHILQNKNNPCIIFSGIKTKNLVDTLKIIESYYNEDKTEFIKFICSFACMTDNTYFTEEIFNNASLKEKFENYYNLDNHILFENHTSEIFNIRLFKKELIELNIQETQFLFSIKDKIKNYQ